MKKKEQIHSFCLHLNTSVSNVVLIVMFCLCKIFSKAALFVRLHQQLLSIYQNRDFITVFHGETEGSEDFDTVLLRSILGGEKTA